MSKLILDTDPGLDDTVAILIALKNCQKLGLKLISVTGGNVSIENCTKNALFLVENFSPKDIDVAKGFAISTTVEASNVHGKTGLGNFKIEKLNKKCIEKNSVEAMHEILQNSEEKVIIACIGPLTNIQMLLQKYPDVKDKIDYIFTMIGSTNGKGNITPFAEFNLYYNVSAFDYVMKSGVNIVISPMQLGEEASMAKSYFTDRRKETFRDKFLADAMSGAFEPNHPNEFFIFDAQVVIGLLYPELYEFRNCEIGLITEGEKVGQMYITEVNKNSKYKVQIMKNVEKIKEKILEELYE